MNENTATTEGQSSVEQPASPGRMRRLVRRFFNSPRVTGALNVWLGGAYIGQCVTWAFNGQPATAIEITIGIVITAVGLSQVFIYPPNEKLCEEGGK